MIKGAAIRVRLLILGILAAYVALMILSTAVLLPIDLELPLVMLGWIAFVGVLAWNARRLRGWRLNAAGMLRPFVLTGVFACLVAAATYLALGWNVPSMCQGLAVGCMKGYTWRVEDGQYFRVSRENQQNQISQNVYLLEVGNRLRSASIFGVYSLCLAWILASGTRNTAAGISR